MLLADIKRLESTGKLQKGRIYTDENGYQYAADEIDRLENIFNGSNNTRDEIIRLGKQTGGVVVTPADVARWNTNDLPPAGAAGEVLAKIDGTNYNVHWITIPSGGSGGSGSGEIIDLGDRFSGSEITDLGSRF